VPGAAECLPSHVCGQNSGLVPFHKDAIHASLIWTKQSECPKLLIWMRPSEYKPRAYLNPTVNGVFSGFNQTYIKLVQGGFGLGMLDESGWSRYAPDLDRENVQLIDVCGLQALIDAGADAVIGHRPGVLRRMDRYRGRPVFWSVDSLVRPVRPGREIHTALARVAVTPDGSVRGRLVPVSIEPPGYPVIRGL
jgi:hypothetical protein